MVSTGDRAKVTMLDLPDGEGPDSIEVALLDLDGVIVRTNAGWDGFCRGNGGTLSAMGVGVSYLQSCAAAGDDPAAVAVGDAIRMALRGDLPSPLSILVPCDSADEKRVFNTLISSRLDEAGECVGATVTLSLASVDEPAPDRFHPTLATPSRHSWAPDPLLALLRVTEIVAAEKNLGQTLRRLVDSARELLGVSYAAISLSGRDGVLEEFAHAGIDAQTLRSLKSGSAIIEWLAERRHSLQTAVALRGRQLVTLHVADTVAVRFTPHVERLAASFAEAAATAIDNARLYQGALQSNRWAEAAAELTQELVSSTSQVPQEIVLRYAVGAADADLAAVLLPEDEESIRLDAIVGGMEGLPPGMLFPREDSPASDVMRTGEPLLLERPPPPVLRVSAEAMGPIAVVPLMAGKSVLGALVAGRRADRAPFTAKDVAALSRFASHAGIALALDQARVDREQLRLHDDRLRIAVELNDHVVRQLFAVGMGLEGFMDALYSAELRGRVSGYVVAIDDSIRAIREAIYRGARD